MQNPKRVLEYMTPDPITLSLEQGVSDVLELMHRGGFRHLPVLKDRHLAGMVSDRDLGRASPSPVAELGRFEMRELLSTVCLRGDDPLCADPLRGRHAAPRRLDAA